MISTKQNLQVTQDRKIKKENLKKHHADLFKKLGVSNPFYSPKMAYFDRGEKVISFFTSELERGENIYTEFVSREYDSEDVNRVLYMWKYNPNYATVYKTNELEANDNSNILRYLVPVDSLIVCEPLLIEEEQFELPDPDLDLPIDQLTIRDLAAILTGKPVSMKSWLNEIIKNK